MRQQSPLILKFPFGYYPSRKLAGSAELVSSCLDGRGVWFDGAGNSRSWDGVSDRETDLDTGARVMAIDHARGSIGGSSTGVSLVKFRGGVLLFVADSASKQVYLDGEALTGVVTSPTPYKVRVAIPNGSGGYDCFDAGLTAPSAPTVTNVAGGTGLMEGTYSLRLRSRRHATDSYSNACAPQTFTVSSSEQPRVTVPAANTSEGQDEWVFEGTKTDEQEGPWYEIQVLTETEVDAAPSRQITLEWADGNLIKILADNMFPPPLCTGISVVNDYVLYWGCGGPNDAPPGPVVAIADPENPEHVDAFARTTTESGESILNLLAAEGRYYALTMNSTQAISFSGGNVSFAFRRLYASGFMNSLAGCIANNTAYLFTGNGLIRSRSEQDVDESFAIPVKEFFRLCDPQYVIVEECPKNRAVVVFCYFPALQLTLGVPFMLDAEIWSAPMPIPGRVMSAAAVGDKLEMRVLRDGHYREEIFDYGNEEVDWWLASHFIDGAPGQDKTVTQWQLVGAAASMRLYQTEIGLDSEFPDVSDLSDAQPGEQELPEGFQHHSIAEVNYADCQSFALRVDGELAGERLEQINLWFYAVGGKR